ncbi:hypothetical protein [Winogradskyella jejuensis]|uniref:DUF4440 domain-containing protein n=1 Tax=Winogradskyella jejuensis TaxID=1089305 RepID=A0A1M5SH23_9FLAO|nr:hypothetical protein [Winogradskyella jejuensis]SHH37897.1 hypothetical protein SAMN05444148_1868 [Winogradskyella jejuensis]
MAEIHSKDLVRVSGGRNISDYYSYINNYKRQFASMKQSNQSNSIALRFFERVTNDSVSSERGVYKLTRNPNTAKAQSYYGQFHVIMKKIGDQWIITMDYDSSESNTIDEVDFNKAHAIDDLDKFLN